MNKGKILALAVVTVMLLTMSMGCTQTKTDTNTPAGNATKAPGNPQQGGTTKETVFDFYNKVSIGQAKAKVDTALGVKGTESTMLKNSFTYVDQNTSFGVSVLFNDKNNATAKTLIYPVNEALAFLTVAPVTQALSDQIKAGMTYDAVKALLGGEGTEINQTQIPFNDNKISVIRIWVNADGSKIQSVFGTDGLSDNAMFFK
ncbi:MAG: hypothetical protein WCL54_02930 [Clostridia bacterium]